MSSDEDEADDDEADNEELAKIIRDRQVKAARAKGSNVPMLLDPKLILDFIDLWHKDPNMDFSGNEPHSWSKSCLDNFHWRRKMEV